MTVIYIIILCFYLITCSGYYKLTMAEPSVQECYLEHPKATVISLAIFALLWPIVSVVVYLNAGLKNKKEKV